MGASPMRSRRPARSAAALSPVAALAAAVALAACASPPAAPPEPAPAPVRASMSLALELVSIQAVDIDTVRIEARASAANDGDVAISLGRVEWSLAAGGKAAGAVDLGRQELEPGARAEAALSFEIDAPPGDEPVIALELAALARYSGPDGVPSTAAASVRSEYPRIRAPVLEILSIRILKDELINTRLGVAVLVRNPNAFPLRFATLGYKLYGEGRYWASGSLTKPFDVPALGSAESNLYLTMNFTDMDRPLFDRVVKLAAVSYRLVGTAGVETGLPFLPLFSLPFDLSGRVEVR